MSTRKRGTTPPPKPARVRTSGEYSDRVLRDQKDHLVYFAPPGTPIPHPRSDYLSGAAIAVALVAVWGLLAVLAFVLQAVIDGFNGEIVGFVLPVGLLLVFTLIAPFLRRRISAEGRLLDALREGEVLSMRDGKLPERLAKQAESDRPGYYEQATRLARVDALRLQAEQMRELTAAGSVAGDRSRAIVHELAEYATRLESAANDQERLVTEYLSGAGRG